MTDPTSSKSTQPADPDAKDASSAPDPTDTDHPAGEEHAADNAENESAG